MLNRVESTLVAVAFCAIVAPVSSIVVQAAHHSKREIHCSESTLQVDFDRLLGQSECLRRDYEMHGATFRELSTEWHRFDRLEDGFLNLRFMEAGPRKHFEYLNLRDELKGRFGRISSRANDWEALMSVNATGVFLGHRNVIPVMAAVQIRMIGFQRHPRSKRIP